MRLLDERGAPAGPERRLTSGPEQSYEPSLATLGERMAIAWYDKSADGTLVSKIGVWRSDGANEWVQTLATRARNPVLRVQGGEIFCAWIAGGADGREWVWAGWWSANGESEWGPVRLAPASKTTWNLNAVAADFRVATVVFDAIVDTKADELFLAQVTPFATRVTRLTADDGRSSKYPDISGTGRYAITWYDARDGNEEVYLLMSTFQSIGSASTLKPLRVTSTKGASIGAYVSWSGSGRGLSASDRIGLAWSDNTEGQNEVYFQEFLNDRTPRSSARRLTTNSSQSLIPAIVPWGEGFALAWNEYVPAAAEKPARSQIAFTIIR